MKTTDQKVPLEFQEHWLQSPDGTKLFIRCAAPDADLTRGRVLLVHGMGEHSARYFHVAEHLVHHGYAVRTPDMRGHGRSGGRRGDVRSYAVLLDDLALIWERFFSENALPSFLYGHSLGGQLAINFAVEKNPSAQGAVITSPWLRLAFAPAWWKLALAQITLKIWPTFTQKTDVNPARLSRDLAFLESMTGLDLVHHLMSARMFAELSRGAVAAADRAGNFHLPLLIAHGAADPVTSAAATEEFFRKVPHPDKTLRIYEDTLHETHNDVGRAQVLEEITRWLSARDGATKIPGAG